MRKRDIKRMLKAEIEQNVPFVLPEVLKTPCKIEDVVECADDSPQTKPYFQFRYLYASLVVFAIMVIALGSFVPDTKRGGLMAGQVQENYIVTTTIQVENASAIIKSNENGKVQSVVINGVEHIWIANCTIEESIEYVIELLDSNLNIDTIMVELDSTKLFNKETDFEHIKQLINIELENVEASARV